MSAGNDWFRSITRPEPEEQELEEQPAPSFDGGVRASIPAEPPSMSALIRQAVHGGPLAGEQHPRDGA